jgi:hypothetical protein
MGRKIFGIILICISTLLFLINILSVRITGAFIGIPMKSNLFVIFAFIFLFVGLLLLSKIGKGLTALVIAGSTIYGGNKLLNLPKDYEKLNSKHIQSVEITKPWASDEGRLQRTYRYDVPLDIIEQKYGLPRGCLKGLMMQESYGDPTRLNDSRDGGAGPFMFQPGTAEEYGLKVYGDSKKTGIDKKHGKTLQALKKKYNSNLDSLSKLDERFDIEKSADAAARYLVKLHNKYEKRNPDESEERLWNRALSAYNRGQSARNPEKTSHVQKVRKYQEMYNNKDKTDYYKLYNKGKIKNFRL